MSRGTQEQKQRRLLIFNYGTITLLGRAFQHIRLSNNFVTSLIINYDVPALQPHSTILAPICIETKIGEWFGLLRFRSPLFTKYLLVYFPPGTEMFYFPG